MINQNLNKRERKLFLSLFHFGDRARKSTPPDLVDTGPEGQGISCARLRLNFVLQRALGVRLVEVLR
jgi:hypothetical protein